MTGALLPVDLQEIREACRQLMKTYGGQDAVGARFGIDQRRVSDMLQSEKLIPLSWIVQLEAATRGLPGHPHVTTALARNVDYLVIERPTAEPCALALPAAVMAISVELGDLARCLSDGIADGELDMDELGAAEQELDQLDARSASLRAQLRSLKVAKSKGRQRGRGL